MEENFNKWKIDELKILLLQYNIDPKNIKGTGKNGNIIKHDLIKKIKKILNKDKFINDEIFIFNKDICHNLLIQSDIEDITNLCYINKSCRESCDTYFWQLKIKKDFNITTNIVPETIYKWIFLYKQINKIYNIMNDQTIIGLYIYFNITTDVLFYTNVYDNSDINFIYRAEEYDVINEQFLRIIFNNLDRIEFQYTELGNKDYYTIIKTVNKDTLISQLITILYYLPYEKIDIL